MGRFSSKGLIMAGVIALGAIVLGGEYGYGKEPGYIH